MHQTEVMKQQLSSDLLGDLRNRTRNIILELQQLKKSDPEVLMNKPAPGSWSVAQVLEHLNSYGKYYLPLIEAKLKANSSKSSGRFTPGILGNYFTNSMLPKNGAVKNKMKSPADHVASNDPDIHEMFEEFLTQEYLMLELLTQSESVDLNRIRIPISLTKLIRLKLGDVFNFIIAHHERHFLQIRNIMQAVEPGFQRASLYSH
jgi:hypothetical protein